MPPGWHPLLAIRGTRRPRSLGEVSGTPLGARAVTTTAMNNRLGDTIVGVRLRLTVGMPAVLAICAAGLPLLALPAAASEAGTQQGHEAGGVGAGDLDSRRESRSIALPPTAGTYGRVGRWDSATRPASLCLLART